MTEQRRKSKDSGAANAQHDAQEKAADGLRMAELSRRALLASDSSNTGSGSSLDLPGVDAALLNPLASLPPHVTLRAAMQGFPPAVHKVDKSGVAD